MKNLIKIGFVVLILAGLSIAGMGYYFFLKGNVSHKGYLYIPNGASYRQVQDSLNKFIQNKNSFNLVAGYKKLSGHFHPGRYTLEPGMSNNHVINLIRSGHQDQISIRIGNYSTINELAGRIGPFLECDSQQILTGIENADFARDGDSDLWLAYFIPNTYNFHWAMTGAEFVRKMKGYYDAFWNESRKRAAQEMGMSPTQVITLASIVQLESAVPSEQPKVAAVYLNRLNKGMRLEADPTVIFAKRKQLGFQEKIDRVYYKDLYIPSPYNTYRNQGLPPGPICMPNPSAIDAVLHPEKSNNLFFVADPNKPGYHIFSETYDEHKQNAAGYRTWINDVSKDKTKTNL